MNPRRAWAFLLLIACAVTAFCYAMWSSLVQEDQDDRERNLVREGVRQARFEDDMEAEERAAKAAEQERVVDNSGTRENEVNDGEQA